MSSFPAWTPPDQWGQKPEQKARAEKAAATVAAEDAVSRVVGSRAVVSVAVRKLEAKPGDVLAFSLPAGAPPQEWMRMAEAIRAAVPKGVAALLLADGVTIEQVRADGIVSAGIEGVFTWEAETC